MLLLLFENEASGRACPFCIWTHVLKHSVQGLNVREKAKQLVTLLKDEEKLREERIHALKTKEKMAQTSSGKRVTLKLVTWEKGLLSEDLFVSPASSAPSAPSLGGSLSLGSHSGGADPEQAWPQSSGEEDLQLQLALAMSKEEAEQVPQSDFFNFSSPPEPVHT